MDKRTEKRKIGDLGESITCRFLKNKGFKIVERNYLKPWGEIDIVATYRGKTYFIEVKTIATDNVSLLKEQYRPEENVHVKKLERMARVVETYVIERRVIGDWQCDLSAVYLDKTHKKARVTIIEHIL